MENEEKKVNEVRQVDGLSNDKEQESKNIDSKEVNDWKEDKKKNPKYKQEKKTKTHIGKIFLNILESKVGALVLLAVVAVIAIRYVWAPICFEFNTEKTVISSETSLTKILKMSKVSTYQTVYNGIAYVYAEDDKKHKEEPVYLVSYEATVKAGVDFNEIIPSVDENKKTITFSLPKIEITDISVDMGKLDIMFKDNDYDTETVSKDAYNAAIKDVEKESKTNQALEDLAKDNLKNAIKGLIQPLLDSEEEKYKILFNEGGK